MANYANLKAAINAVIKQNGQGEITGEVMNQVLTAMVNSLGSNYQLAGVATPSTNPGTPDQNVFYMATKAGTYTNFSAIVLQAGISILLWDGSWSSETFFTIDAVPTSGSNNFITSGAVFDNFKLDGGAYDVTAHNNNATFADLSALLNSENLNTLIPVAVRHGGMSIRFVQTSDNKYVQYRFMSSTTSGFTDEENWQGIEDIPVINSKNIISSGGVADFSYNKNFGLIKASYWNVRAGGLTYLYQGVLATRVAVTTIPANCRIELSDGYAFRNIKYVAYDGIIITDINCASKKFVFCGKGFLRITLCKENPSEAIDDITGIIKSAEIGKEYFVPEVSKNINNNNLTIDNSTGKYVSNSAYSFAISYIKVIPSHSIFIDNTYGRNMSYAFLKSIDNRAANNDADFSDEITSLQTSETPLSIVVPSDAKYLFLRRSYTTAADTRHDIFDYDIHRIISPETQDFTIKEKLQGSINIGIDTLSIYDNLFKMSKKEVFDIDINLFFNYKKYITNANIWSAAMGVVNNCILIPVIAGYTYRMKANQNNGSIYALLKSNTEVGEGVDFSSSLGNRVVLSANQEVDIIIPDDTHFLYLFKQTYDGDFLPTSLKVIKPVTKPFNEVVFMGDSITHGVYSYWNDDIHNDNNRYNGFDLLSDFAMQTNEAIIAAATAYHGIHYYFGLMACCNVVNLARRGSGYVQDGRGGGTFLDLIEGNPNKTLGGISPYNFANVDLVVVCLGINDYINGKPIGDVSQFQADGSYTRGTIIGNLAIGIKDILAENPFCKIIICSPYNSFGQVSQGGDYIVNPPIYYGNEASNYALGYDVGGGGTLQNYIDAIDAVCSYYGIQHVALSKSNVCNRITLSNIMIDGLHPSKESYIKLAGEIFGKANYGD